MSLLWWNNIIYSWLTYISTADTFLRFNCVRLVQVMNQSNLYQWKIIAHVRKLPLLLHLVDSLGHQLQQSRAVSLYSIVWTANTGEKEINAFLQLPWYHFYQSQNMANSTVSPDTLFPSHREIGQRVSLVDIYTDFPNMFARVIYLQLIGLRRKWQARMWSLQSLYDCIFT